MRAKIFVAVICLVGTIAGCSGVEPHAMRPIGHPDAMGRTLYVGQFCVDQDCWEGGSVAALYGQRGDVTPLSPMYLMSAKQKTVLGAAAILGGVSLGLADGLSH